MDVKRGWQDTPWQVLGPDRQTDRQTNMRTIHSSTKRKNGQSFFFWQTNMRTGRQTRIPSRLASPSWSPCKNGNMALIMQRTLLACDSLTRSQHVCAAQHRPSAAAAVVPASFHPLKPPPRSAGGRPTAVWNMPAARTSSNTVDRFVCPRFSATSSTDRANGRRFFFFSSLPPNWIDTLKSHLSATQNFPIKKRVTIGSGASGWRGRVMVAILFVYSYRRWSSSHVYTKACPVKMSFRNLFWFCLLLQYVFHIVNVTSIFQRERMGVCVPVWTRVIDVNVKPHSQTPKSKQIQSQPHIVWDTFNLSFLPIESIMLPFCRHACLWQAHQQHPNIQCGRLMKDQATEPHARRKVHNRKPPARSKQLYIRHRPLFFGATATMWNHMAVKKTKVGVHLLTVRKILVYIYIFFWRPTSCAPCCVVDRRSVQFHPYFCCSEAGVSPLTHLASERVRTEFVHIPLVTALHRQGARAARDAVRGKGEDGEEGDRVPGWRQTRARHKTQMGAGQDSMLAPGFLSKEKHCWWWNASGACSHDQLSPSAARADVPVSAILWVSNIGLSVVVSGETASANSRRTLFRSWPFAWMISGLLFMRSAEIYPWSVNAHKICQWRRQQHYQIFYQEAML